MLAVDGLNGECGDFTLTTRLHGATTGILPDDGHGGQLTLSSRPNPTRGEVSFTGGVPAQASQVHLTIHDAAGRLVSRLESPASSGRFSLAWDGRDLNGVRVHAGVYFVRVFVGGQSSKSTLVVTR